MHFIDSRLMTVNPQRVASQNSEKKLSSREKRFLQSVHGNFDNDEQTFEQRIDLLNHFTALNGQAPQLRSEYLLKRLQKVYTNAGNFYGVNANDIAEYSVERESTFSDYMNAKVIAIRDGNNDRSETNYNSGFINALALLDIILPNDIESEIFQI